MFIDIGMDKQNMVYTCNGGSLSLKKERNSEHAIAWMKLEDFMLNKISQSHTHTHKKKFHLYAAPREVRFIETESRWSGLPGRLSG